MGQDKATELYRPQVIFPVVGTRVGIVLPVSYKEGEEVGTLEAQ
jgi:hypothetical protein